MSKGLHFTYTLRIWIQLAEVIHLPFIIRQLVVQVLSAYRGTKNGGIREASVLPTELPKPVRE